MVLKKFLFPAFFMVSHSFTSIAQAETWGPEEIQEYINTRYNHQTRGCPPMPKESCMKANKWAFFLDAIDFEGLKWAEQHDYWVHASERNSPNYVCKCIQEKKIEKTKPS